MLVKRSHSPLLFEGQLRVHFFANGAERRTTEVEGQTLPRLPRRIGTQVQIQARS